MTAPTPDTPDTADRAMDVAREVVALVPTATLWRRLWTTRVPPIADLQAGCCPRCGRLLPAARPFGPGIGFSGGGSVALTDHELTLYCLVDGWRARHSLRVELDPLLRAAGCVADGLRDRGWHTQARRIDDALAVDGEALRAEAVGQTLEALRRFGSIVRTPKAKQRPPRWVSPLERLVVSTATFWPVRPDQQR